MEVLVRVSVVGSHAAVTQPAPDLIDEQPRPVLESLSDYCCDLGRTDAHPKERLAIRAAYVEYCKEALKEAHEREDQLYHALTGIPEDE
jgi:hypothetical protein